MLLVSAIHRILVTVGIVAIGRLVSVVIVSAVRGLLVTIGFLAIGRLVFVVSTVSWLLVTIGFLAIAWLVSAVAVSAIGFWRLISVLRLVSIRFVSIFIGFVFVLFCWRIRRWCFLPTFVSLLAKSNDDHSE